MKPRQIGSIVLGVLAALCLAGCSTPATRIKANPEAFARLTPQQLGFDQEAVKLALGEPDRVAVRTDADGETIIWHYVTYESNGRMLFTGHYHTGRHWWGWGAAYPYYLDFPDRRVRDRFRVDFKRGLVAAITEDRSS